MRRPGNGPLSEEAISERVRASGTVQRGQAELVAAPFLASLKRSRADASFDRFVVKNNRYHITFFWHFACMKSEFSFCLSGLAANVK